MADIQAQHPDEPVQRHIMVVFSQPHEGRDDEYNEWYSGEHLDDVLGTPGFVGAQRFKVNDLKEVPAGQFTYLAIYEIEGDLETAVDALVAGRPDRQISDAFDASQTQAWTFSPLGPRKGA